MSTKFEKIEFASEGAGLRGRLYRPSNVSADVPVVIMAHGFSVLAAWLEDIKVTFMPCSLIFHYVNKEQV